MYSMVQRVLIVDGRAVGVAFRKRGSAGLHIAYATREVILSAGAVQTPQVCARARCCDRVCVLKQCTSARPR